MRAILLVLTALPLLAGCQTQQKPAHTSAPANVAIHTAPELVDLSFMTGRWITIGRDGGVTEEHWTAPRGSAMMGMLRAVYAAQGPQKFVVMSITVEPEGVIFRIRQIDQQGAPSEVQVYRLTSATAGRAVFSAVANTRGIASATYTASGPNQLTVDIAFDAETQKSGFQNVYARDPE